MSCFPAGTWMLASGGEVPFETPSTNTSPRGRISSFTVASAAGSGARCRGAGGTTVTRGFAGASWRPTAGAAGRSSAKRAATPSATIATNESSATDRRPRRRRAAAASSSRKSW